MHFSEVFSQQELGQLRQAGYNDMELQKAVDEYTLEQNLKGSSMPTASRVPTNTSQSMFYASPQDNLIKFQLELDSLLERAEHILRGDIIEIKDGNVYWIKVTDESQRILNDYGVNEVLKILCLYVNRNTILSNYPDEQKINDKVYDFGIEVSDLVFNNAEKFGLTTDDKRKHYPMLIREIVDIVHSAYLRALRGMERQSLREARQVTQNEIMGGQNQMGVPAMRERSILNPLRYVTGKYK